jgi:hypothetical protein
MGFEPGSFAPEADCYAQRQPSNTPQSPYFKDFQKYFLCAMPLFLIFTIQTMHIMYVSHFTHKGTAMFP